MRNQFLGTVILAIVIAMSGCHADSSAEASEGASSPVFAAVGPVPGSQKSVLFRTNPFANDPVALQEGYKLFNWYNCSGCHGGHAGGGMGPSLRDAVWIFGDRDDQIYDSIAAGRGNGMPSWGRKIPEQQIWKLVTYIKSMRTSQEPDAPSMPAAEQVAPPAIYQAH
ncbi:MAG TPA: c-type cytochrome [Terriglobales bacterium]|jgi:cytochrome c oxidase cbb3-type subunit 3|nr:c-type cytochrome [Terriglobales bacterium]